MEPMLRFKADDGSEFPKWEEKKIGEICVINPKTEEVEDEFLYMDLGSVDHGDWEEPEVMIKSKAPSRAQRVARVGDVFFQSVRPYNQGHFHYSEKKDKQVVASTGYIQIRMKNCDSGFIYQILYDAHFNQEVSIRCTGSNYPAINADDFSEIVIAYPCVEEQRKIADCLSSVDDIITATQSELLAWQERKKGVMQKIFNREVRFKADDGSEFPKWEEKRLGELGEFIRGLSYNKTQVLDDGSDASGTAVLRSNNINSDGTLDYRDDVQLVSKEPSSEQQLCENDVVICMANGSNRLVGKAARYDGGYDARRITVGAFCGIFRTDSPLVPWWFQSDDYKSFLHLSKQGGDGALANLKGKDIEAISLLFPSSSTEQRKIADCLSSLDDVINQINAELSAWKEFKKGLLQQMFV